MQNTLEPRNYFHLLTFPMFVVRSVCVGADPSYWCCWSTVGVCVQLAPAPPAAMSDFLWI